MTLTDTITIMATDDDVSHSLTMNLYHVSAWTVGVEARPTPVFPWHSLVPFLTNVPQSPKDKNKPEPPKGKVNCKRKRQKVTAAVGNADVFDLLCLSVCLPVPLPVENGTEISVFNVFKSGIKDKRSDVQSLRVESFASTLENIVYVATDQPT